MSTNNFQFPYQQNSFQTTPGQSQSIQQFFPAPQGSVYSIGTALDIGNVPIGSTGLSVALCLNESLMYIKSFQNGNPIIMAYRIEPFHKNNEVSEQVNQREGDLIQDLLLRVKALEDALTKAPNETKGGKFNELL